MYVTRIPENRNAVDVERFSENRVVVIGGGQRNRSKNVKCHVGLINASTGIWILETYLERIMGKQ